MYNTDYRPPLPRSPPVREPLRFGIWLDVPVCTPGVKHRVRVSMYGYKKFSGTVSDVHNVYNTKCRLRLPRLPNVRKALRFGIFLTCRCVKHVHKTVCVFVCVWLYMCMCVYVCLQIRTQALQIGVPR